MNDSSYPELGPACPFCGQRGIEYCDHMIGWTEDGRMIEMRKESLGRQPLLPTDRTVNTGVSTRVYRDWVFA